MKYRRLTLTLSAAVASALAASVARAQAVSDPATAPASSPAQDEVQVLSPFEVVSTNKGYFSGNTMSGTRFNTNVEDLASSITVVTKEQMADFAMLDVNDIFMYTASTEGSSTYTDFNIDRNGSVTDNVQLNPTQANRVRGIGAANISLGNFETMGRIPVDPLMMESIEVSRGPNANVFGLGNPAGTVNMVAASANLTRDRSQVVLRADSDGGFRTTLDVNRVLKNNVLAVRVNGGFQHDAFVRKPSGMNTVRYNGMVKFRPFKYTTISGSFSYYRSNGNRPNFSPPRDGLSYWIASGRPTWDPVDQVIHVNGQTLTGFTKDSSVPDYFNRSFVGATRSYLYIDRGGIQYWGLPNTSVSSLPLLSSSLGLNSSGTARLMQSSTAAGTGGTGLPGSQPLFSTTPSVSDKSVYDWSSLNLASVNRTMDEMQIPMLQIDQTFFSTPMNSLTAQFGFMREDSERYQRNHLGIGNDNGQSGQLVVDVNERMLDGSPNPFFLHPYIGQDQPRTTWQPARWDTYRVQLAYTLDLTREHNALKWLGMHQINGYDEYKYRLQRRFSYRDAMASDNAFLPAGITRGVSTSVPGGAAGSPNITRPYLRYYVGDANGTNVDYAPQDYTYGTYTFNWGGQNGIWNREPVLLDQVAATDSSGGSSNTKTILKTVGGVVQSHFLRDTVVTTFGVREDRQYVRNGAEPRILNPDGKTFPYDYYNHWAGGDWKFNSGKTKTYGGVVRPFRELPWVKNAANGTGIARIFGDMLRGLSFTYNRSDSFRPQDPKMDIFLRPLPNPAGVGEDYGFWLNMFDNKVVLRVNRYDNRAKDNQGTDINTISQRLTRFDVSSGAAFLLAKQATDWVTAIHPTWTPDQIDTEVAKEIGLSPELQDKLLEGFNSGNIAGTMDTQSKGTEIELNLNPTPNWTVAASFTEMQSINTNVSNAANEWIKQRMPIWTTIVDPRTNTLWWNTNYGGSQTAAQNYAVFIDTPYSKLLEQQGKSRPEVRRYASRVSTKLKLSAFTDHSILKNFTVGGALRWEDKAAIGYYGVEQLPAIVTHLDSNRPIWEKAHLYVDAFIGYRTRLFRNRVPTSVQVNVRNLQEGGHLQPISAYPDGTPNAYRIVDPRQFILQVSFDL